MKNNSMPLPVEELYNILDNIDDAIFVDDADGYAIWLNKACEDLYKIKRDEILGKSIDNLENEGVFKPSVAKLVLRNKLQTDLVHENKEGKKILSTGTPILDERGEISSVITTSRDITQLVHLQEELQFAQDTLQGLQEQEKFYTGDVIAHSQVMFNVLQLTKRLSTIESTVLITGESGVGKGVIARLLHENGARSESGFVKVNCGAIPENLIESELFGYEGGAFTGSKEKGKRGLFETADGGSIFLDEISELPLNLQVKLLQVIQDREIVRVGGTEAIPIDVRIISATNVDLFRAVQNAKFREDLYYRLNVVPIHVPPLRERPEDIAPLISHFLSSSNKQMKEHKEITPDALAILTEYNWPGNVRELENIVERLIITTREDAINPENIPGFILDYTKDKLHEFPSSPTPGLREALEDAERKIFAQALREHKSTRKIAKALRVSQPTVVRKLQKYGLKRID